MLLEGRVGDALVDAHSPCQESKFDPEPSGEGLEPRKENSVFSGSSGTGADPKPRSSPPIQGQGL